MPNAIELGRSDLLAWNAARPRSFYDGDLARVLEARMGRDRFEAAMPAIAEAGALAAGELSRLGTETNLDQNLPRLERWSGLGERTEEVVFHPSYHEAGRLIWNSGVLARYEQPGRELETLSMLYLFAHVGEIGHLCPLACTAGMIKILKAAGSADQRARWLPKLYATRYEDRWHASQFLTEVQGGSDVGANAVVARRDGDGWRIFGEKWFCSVIDAKMFLVTARPEGAPEGTRGLGVFLVPRQVDGKANGFTVRRLKVKLGTRAMASAEADFDGAVAESIGALDRGFKNVVELVLDTSRVYNAACCAGGMHRAYLEAATFAKHRTAFGRPIAEYPLIQEALATLRAESLAALSSTMRLADMGDRIERGQGDDRLRAARRMGVNINKYWTAIRNTQMARLAMEVFGGNGTIETFSVLPQLYRDAMVLESWEGAHNVLVQQVMRDAERYGMHRALTGELEEALAKLALPPGDAELIERTARGIRATEEPLARLAKGELDQRWGRRVCDRLAVCQALVALLEELATAPTDEARRGAVRFLLDRDVAGDIGAPVAVPAGLLA